MARAIDRRQFLKLAGLGGVGVVLGSALPGIARAHGDDEFYFLQMSDTHWGFEGPPNPDAKGTLQKAVQAVNSLEAQPDFIIFTGDLTHTTDDAAERRKRMGEFRDIAKGLKVKTVHFLPGEHDASLDNGAAFKEFFGETHYAFDHKGVHFIALDNVSDPAAKLGDEQLAWLKADLAKQKKSQPIVVFAHRPLFDLKADWDWNTRDGQAAIDQLMPFEHVVVFYGHIHQENHHSTGHIDHHAAESLIFPLIAPGSAEKRAPVPWDASAPFKGLGWRSVDTDVQKAAFRLQEHPADKV